MQYEVNTPADYLKALDADWRKDSLLELRKLIQAKAPELVEGINYKMLSYAFDDVVVFHLNAQKNYVSLYVGDIQKIDTDGSLLKGINQGKGCVRFKKSNDLSETRIHDFIDKMILYFKNGGDVSC